MADVMQEDLSDVTLAAQVAAVKRELAFRERAYPKWVAAGRMRQDEADKQMRAMRAVLKTVLLAEQATALI